MQLLVGEVDAQLLEGVGAEVLEAEDVERVEEDRALGPRVRVNSPARVRRAPHALAQHLVDARDHPVEAEAVERLEQALQRGVGLLCSQVDAHTLASHLEAAVCEKVEQVRLPHDGGGAAGGGGGALCRRHRLRRGRRLGRRGRAGLAALAVVLAVGEGYVGEVQHGGKQTQQQPRLVGGDGHVAHGAHRRAEALQVVDATRARLAAVREERVLRRRRAQLEISELKRAEVTAGGGGGRGLGAGEQLIEGVEVALLLRERDDARLLEQVRLHQAAAQLARLRVHAQADALAEARAVRIARRLGVAQRLEQRVGLKDARGQHRVPIALAARAPHDVPERELVGLRLACAALTRDDERLGATAVACLAHRLLGDRVDVRRVVE
mmetsp:Transcript_22251/g.56605  ORF Transcript_22251/g.56605 Transcript_22251/m.56605 type:complete len:381 (-) Transcript_22251:299-1441(-)